MTGKQHVHHPRACLLTLGCAKNLVDSEQIASMLESRGVEVTHRLESCNVAVVNTCGFIEPAKEESIEVILEVAGRKAAGDLQTLIVTGCLSQRYGGELEKALPEVDVFTGIDPAAAACAVLDALGLSSSDLPGGVSLRHRRFTPPAWAYLRISHGCDNRCAYCTIPLIRGPLRSRDPARILDEARYLAEQGVREVNVIGQDTAAYGTDRPDGPRLHELLRGLCRIDALKWVRLLYAHPAHVGDELVEVLGSEDKVCKYLDIPLQHVNDRILGRMGRGIGRAQVEKLIDRLRRKIPELTLRTTLLVGFPGETEGEFSELLDFVRAVRFDRLGCFAYWPEEGTRAAEMPDQLPEDVRQARRDEVMAAQQEIAFELAAERAGERCEVLMEEGEPLEDALLPARSRKEAPDVDPLIYVEAPAPEAGRFVTVEITGSIGYDCIAHTVPEDGGGQ